MKKFVSLFLSCCLFVSLCGIALAADIVQPTLKIQNGRLVDSPDVQYIVDKYFSLRKRAFLLQEREENSIDAIKDISSNREVWEKEEQRLSARDNLAEHHGVHVIDANNSAYVISASFIDNTNLMLDVYEWTWIRYNDGKDGPIDEMGYATDHQIKIEQAIDGSLSIIEDIYDESEIIGGAFIPSEKSILTEVSENSFETKGVNSNIDYEVNAVIDYADTWVIHEYASNMQNFSYYNLSTYGYYSADCANFVSQCMRAGGMQWDYGSGKDNGNWDGTQWWFDINPDPNYENYTVSPPSWRSVSKFIEYWNNQGYASVSASTSSVYPGNPVYVSGHVGICVGYNSSGTPIINAHNRDVYHVPYTMIGSTEKNTIQIVTSNKMVYKPAGATEILPTSTTQVTPLKYISAGANHYYTFDVNTAGYYTFESSYYETSFDTKAYLYKESQTSNGKTLYMYEVAQDDDSGEGINFKIYVYLNPGKYYLRVTGYKQISHGYYYLNYRRG